MWVQLNWSSKQLTVPCRPTRARHSAPSPFFSGGSDREHAVLAAPGDGILVGVDRPEEPPSKKWGMGVVTWMPVLERLGKPYGADAHAPGASTMPADAMGAWSTPPPPRSAGISLRRRHNFLLGSFREACRV